MLVLLLKSKRRSSVMVSFLVATDRDSLPCTLLGHLCLELSEHTNQTEESVLIRIVFVRLHYEPFVNDVKFGTTS